MKVCCKATTPGDDFISVVIPAYNEASVLAATLENITFPKSRVQTIVVDGGSADETVAMAQAAGCTVLSSCHRQRAFQMNVGAAAATGSVLLFLHADTLLPPGALPTIVRALADPAVGGGAFSRRYDTPSNLLAVTCWFAQLRNRSLGWHLGDQAMFVRRELFVSLGGFLERDLFEDLDFSRRLARRAKVVTLNPPVISSGRRFNARGALGTTCRDLSLTWRYFTREVWPSFFHRGSPQEVERSSLRLPDYLSSRHE